MLRRLPLLLPSKALNPNLLRRFSNPPQWTETVHYLDESGAVISTAPGVRAAAPGRDAEILDGSLARRISRPQAASKIAELALRWRWGPDLDRHLDRLPFPPDSKLVVSALSSIPSHDHEPALSVFRWARRQSWFVASDEAYVVLLERLFIAKDFDGIHKVFDDILEVVEGKHADFEGNLGSKGGGGDKGDAFGGNWGSNDDIHPKDFLSAGDIGPRNAALRGNWVSGGELEAKGATFEGTEGSAAEIEANGAAFSGNWGSAGNIGAKGNSFKGDLGSFSGSLNLAVQYLCRASMIEVCYCCFKKLKDAGFKGLSSETYNLLISLFLSKGLPYKAFEIYETMEGSGCTLDVSTFDLMIPALAKTGRLDAAIRLFNGLKAREGGGKPGLPIYLALVDCVGKAGRLDAAMELYREMQSVGYRPMVTMYVSMIESLVKAGKLDAGLKLWDEMKSAGFRPNFGLYTLMVETQARSGRLEVAASTFSDMEKSGFLPTPSTYACLVEMHSAAGQVDLAMRLYNSMTSAGLRPGLSTFTALLTVLAKKKLLDMAGKILLEMKAVGFAVDVHASDILMIYIKDGSTDLALRWLRFMGSAGIRTNNFIVRQLFESCMKAGLYDSARPLLETYVGSAAKVDLILYTSILAHLVRCQEEKNERAIMDILSTTRHKAHDFMCELFTGPEQRKQPVLSLVREFFQGIDYEAEESAAKYFVNVLLNYLVLMGQLNRARCVWKVAYENKLFPKAIVFDQHIAWSLDVRNLSVGAALVAVVHTLHRFRKRMLYYGAVPRRIKLVTGPTLKMVIAQVLESVESPFEVSKVVLRAPGDSVSEWFNKPIVRQFLLNEIPSKADVLMHKLNVLFPSSAPEVRSLSHPRSMPTSR